LTVETMRILVDEMAVNLTEQEQRRK